MKHVLVNRLVKTNDDVISTVEVDDTLMYYGLESLVKLIPEGIYILTKYFSPKHGFYVPLVNNVPGHEGIEIHICNTVKDVDGCLGIADNIVNEELIANSIAAVHPFYADFFTSMSIHQQITIIYKNLFNN